MQIISACIARDLAVYKATIESLRANIPDARPQLVTRSEDFKKFRNACGSELTLWDENELVPEMTIAELKNLPISWFPAGAGWYFQQFLKYAFVNVSNNDDHFLIWDSDTVLLRPIDFFDPHGRPIYTKATEHHIPYFQTFEHLIGFPANREYSFISQHQIINKNILREMLSEIESSNPENRNWAWAIMNNLRGEGTNLFSEYETYGHFMKMRHPGTFVTRDLDWTRQGGGALGLPPIKPLLLHLRKKYDFAAFEASDGPCRRILKLLRGVKSYRAG